MATSLSLLFFIIFFLLTPHFTISITDLSYSSHCAHLVPESPPTPTFSLLPPNFLHLFNGHAAGAATLLSSSSAAAVPAAATFSPRRIIPTLTPGVFKIDGAVLTLRIVNSHVAEGRFLRVVNPRFSSLRGALRFRLSGYWSSSSGYLCVVGSGNKRGSELKYNVVFKANYPNNSVISTSLVTGSLESLSSKGSFGYFEPISVMGFTRMNYEYSLIKKEIENGSFRSENDDDVLKNVSLSMGSFRSCYGLMSLSRNFELSYRTSCDDKNCSLIDGVLGFLPKFMSINEFECSDEEMFRVALVFSNASDLRNGYYQPVDPRRMLIAEGAWNEKRSQICFVGCRILNFSRSDANAYVGDCSFRMNLSFPSTLTIRFQSVINGQIWSNKSVGEVGYFEKTKIRTSSTKRVALPRMKYQYTEIERSKKYCSDKKDVRNQKGLYPDAYSSDMKFDVAVKSSKGDIAWGNARPVYIGDRYVRDSYPYFRSSIVSVPKFDLHGNTTQSDMVNVSYHIAFISLNEFKLGGKIFQNESLDVSAEGIYDTNTGRLCMAGCWDRDIFRKSLLDSSEQDCEIFVEIQFPSRKSKGRDVVKGSIESKRGTSDARYFERIELSSTSISQGQAAESIWRMDIEITLVLISNTLTCVFVGLQLFHIKRHPDVIPFISIVMLVVLTLGHMIPLLLNIEAMLTSSPSKRTVLLGSGGWLELNEVLVRVITMVAFLLEFRLLQLTWSTRSTDTSQNTLWVSEKKVVFLSLPLYVCGALIARFMQKLKGSSHPHTIRFPMRSNPTFSLWGDLKSYAGCILDAFLLPQIVFNIFTDSKTNALASPYYIGTTVVRLVPHAYDLVRAHTSLWKFDPWYIYANPRMNYYSTSWDIVISCVGLLFVVLVFLQQRFGGRCILPRRFRTRVDYEKVPSVGGE